MRKKRGGLNRYHYKLYGECVYNPISFEVELIHDQFVPINDITFKGGDDEDFTRKIFISMLDLRYGSYTEIINQNFRPFKKR